MLEILANEPIWEIWKKKLGDNNWILLPYGGRFNLVLCKYLDLNVKTGCSRSWYQEHELIKDMTWLDPN
jgi:hypothetical protein